MSTEEQPLSGDPLRWALADKLCDWHYDRSLSWQEIADRVLAFMEDNANASVSAASMTPEDTQ